MKQEKEPDQPVEGQRCDWQPLLAGRAQEMRHFQYKSDYSPEDIHAARAIIIVCRPQSE